MPAEQPRQESQNRERQPHGHRTEGADHGNRCQSVRQPIIGPVLAMKPPLCPPLRRHTHKHLNTRKAA